MLKSMKWWGWGEESLYFDHTDKPALRGFLLDQLGVDTREPGQYPSSVEDLWLSAPTAPESLLAALREAVGDAHVRTDPETRLTHTYGKSLRDLVRIRLGDVGRMPDAVVYPQTEAQVEAVVHTAVSSNAVIIPFGGGSNVSGGVEASREETRPVLSVDLGRMDRVLEIDPISRLARIQAGASGPQIESQLAESGWTLGHFPDSFAHSTLGGWIATRSSGMLSDTYGDIAEIVKAVRVVTPIGVLATRPVPAASTGPSVLQMVLGSEGRIGVITEAVAQVRPISAVRTVHGCLFPDWDSGLAAARELSHSALQPLFVHVSDPVETAFSLAIGTGPRRAGGRVNAYLKSVRRFRLDQSCLAFIGFEGSHADVRRQRREAEDLIRKHRGVPLGTGSGALYERTKFDFPYIRDFLLDRGTLVGEAETAAPWSKLGDIYQSVLRAAKEAFSAAGVVGSIMCHLSHGYRSGACLCFTFAFRAADEYRALAQYDLVKGRIQQTFVDQGGAISHHNAVGTEHAHWLQAEVSTPGRVLIDMLLSSLDPGMNLNPGKITD